MKLTEKRRECLRTIERVEKAQDLAPIAAEVSRLAGHVDYWAWPKLKALEGYGYVEEVRERRWRLTDAGRALLAEEKPDA